MASLDNQGNKAIIELPGQAVLIRMTNVVTVMKLQCTSGDMWLAGGPKAPYEVTMLSDSN